MIENNFIKEPSVTNFIELINAAKSLSTEHCEKKIKIALVTNFASAHLKTLLEVLLNLNKIDAQIYCPTFGLIETEVINPDSKMYKHEPDMVVILQSVQTLSFEYYNRKTDKFGYEQHILEKTFALWEGVRLNSNARIIQGNFVEPLNRPFGNFDAKIPWALTSIVKSINYKIGEKLRSEDNILFFDVNSLSSYYGRENWLDETGWHDSKMYCSLKYLPQVAKSISDICTAAYIKTTKCVVLDLDNTIWGGVIGDDGIEGIDLSPEGEGAAFMAFQSYLLSLKQRGIILAVASKNNHDIAIDAFRNHPYMVLKESDISVFAINWHNKADNIQMIKETLNIGFDSMVFLDDNPVERALVTQFLPEVTVPDLPRNPANYLCEISKYNLFETVSFSDEDRSRGKMYIEQIKRTEASKQFTNIDEFLRSLEMEATIDSFQQKNMNRIVQLTQKSNQFNLTTNRYNSEEILSIIADSTLKTFTVSLKDKFGDYGIISTIVLKTKENKLLIEQWLMSCRALSRGVESMMMNHIFNFAKTKSLETIIGKYSPNKKNNLVKDFYKNFKFNKINNENETQELWHKKTSEFIEENFYIKVNEQG